MSKTTVTDEWMKQRGYVRNNEGVYERPTSYGGKPTKVISTPAFKNVEHLNPSDVIIYKRGKQITKKSKYRNVRCEYDGLKFDSQKERDYYIFLKGEEKAKRISHLSCQKVFEIKVNDKLICKYRSDFWYINLKTNLWECVDVKSEITKKNATYRLKKKLLKSVLNIDIIEK